MDRTENQESPASPARVGAAADRIRELKPNADGKYRKIIDIITDLHALIAVYQGIKSKLIRGADEWEINLPERKSTSYLR